MSRVVFAQEWQESERGWGVRPDGFYLFLTKDDAKKGTEGQVKRMREREAEHKIYQGSVPDEYSSSCGNPRPLEVSDETHAKIVASEHKCMYVNHLSEVEFKQQDNTIKTASIYEVKKPANKENFPWTEMSKDDLVKLIKSATEELSKR